MTSVETARVRAIELAFEYSRGLGGCSLDEFLELVLTMETIIFDGATEAIRTRKTRC